MGSPYTEGPDVEAVQLALYVDSDKQYGPHTRDAVHNWKLDAGYPTRANDGELGVAGQRMRLGLDPVPPAFAKRAEERTSGADALDAFIVGRIWHWPAPYESALAAKTSLRTLPTIIFSGDVDASVPTVITRRLLTEFPHAYFITVAGAAHPAIGWRQLHTPDRRALPRNAPARRHIVREAARVTSGSCWLESARRMRAAL